MESELELVAVEDAAVETFATAESDAPKPRRRLRCWHVCAATLACLCVAAVLALALVFAIVLIGLAVEKVAVDAAGDNTARYYESARVCATNRTSGARSSFRNATAARATRDHAVTHCGDCGQCSSPNDIDVMNATKDTLTKTATDCSLKAFSGGAAAVDACFQERVGFTPGCTECWVNNVMCDQKLCVYTCIWTVLIKREPNNRAGNLNDCLLCDERMCGPAFVECAGANRRRLGIATDIQRKAALEMCGANK